MRLLVSLFISAWWLPCSGQELSTDRPDQTESAWVVPLHCLQIESGIALNRSDHDLTWNILQNLWRYAPAERLEFRLVTGLSLASPENPGHRLGFDDLEVGLKYQFVQSRVPLAMLIHILLPTGNAPFSSGQWGTSWKLAWSHALGDWVEVGYNTGVDLFPGLNPQYTYSLSIATALTPRTGFYLEPFGIWGRSPSWDTGLTFLVSPTVQLDFSLGFGFQQTANYYAMGCSWRLPH
ncbi:MAG: transporter [Saprospiraceae bacterium]